MFLRYYLLYFEAMTSEKSMRKTTVSDQFGQQDNAKYGHVVRHPIAKQTATTKLQLTVPVLHKETLFEPWEVTTGFRWF